MMVNTFRFGMFSMLSPLYPAVGSSYTDEKKVIINVGYLPITDHLILPISHALDKDTYKGIQVRTHLCRSWDEVIGKMDMGILNAAFLLAPLAMHVFLNKNMRCVLLGHRDGSVIAAAPGIRSAASLHKEVIGIPHHYSTHTLLLYKYFKDHGITDFHNLKLRKVPPPVTVEQVQSGKIKGYSVAEPWGITGVSKGIVRILEYSKNIIPGHACCIVMVQEHLLQRQRPAVAEWIESLHKAGITIQQQPEKAAELQKPYMYHSADDILQVLDKKIISYQSLAPDKAALQVIHDLALESGLIHDRIHMDDFIDAGFAG